MKKITKILLLLLVCVSTLSLTGCVEKNVEGELSDIMTKIYDGIAADEMPMVENFNPLDVEIQPLSYYIGDENIDYKEILVSEPVIGSIAYSVVLVRMEENADIEEAKTAIEENIDPRKWTCVWVEKDDVIVKSKGDLIILIMVENETLREKIEEGFDNL